MSKPQEVGAGDSEDSCDENSKDREKIDPGGRPFFYSDVLADGI
jgi:hypothetical protein